MCLDKKYMHREDEMGMSKQKSYKKASKAQVFMLFIMIAMIIVIGIVGYRLFVNNEDICELLFNKKKYTEDDVENLVYTQIFPMPFQKKLQFMEP